MAKASHIPESALLKVFFRQVMVVWGIFIGVAILLFSLPGVFMQPAGLHNTFYLAISACTLTGCDLNALQLMPTVLGQWLILLVFQAAASLVIGVSLYMALLLGLQLPVLPWPRRKLSLWPVVLRAFIFLFVLELVFSIAGYMFWRHLLPGSGSQVFFYSFFHTASVVCHAGFTLFPGSMGAYPVSSAYIMLVVLAFTALGAGMGYPAWRDVFSLKRLRQRLSKPEDGWLRQTNVSLYVQLGLFLFATMLLFFGLGSGNYGGDKYSEKFCTAAFNATGATTGMVSLQTEDMPAAMLLLYIPLMLAGPAAGAAGGGLRGTMVYALLNGLMHRTGKAWMKALYTTALWALAFAGVCILAGSIAMAIIQPKYNFLECLFNSASAFSNAGLALHAGRYGAGGLQILLCMLMLAGRLGIPLLIFRQMWRARKGVPEGAAIDLMPY